METFRLLVSRPDVSPAFSGIPLRAMHKRIKRFFLVGPVYRSLRKIHQIRSVGKPGPGRASGPVLETSESLWARLPAGSEAQGPACCKQPAATISALPENILIHIPAGASVSE